MQKQEPLWYGNPMWLWSQFEHDSGQDGWRVVLFDAPEHNSFLHVVPVAGGRFTHNHQALSAALAQAMGGDVLAMLAVFLNDIPVRLDGVNQQRSIPESLRPGLVLTYAKVQQAKQDEEVRVLAEQMRQTVKDLAQRGATKEQILVLLDTALEDAEQEN